MAEKKSFLDYDEHEVLAEVIKRIEKMSFAEKVKWYKAVSIPGVYDILVKNSGGDKAKIEQVLNDRLIARGLMGTLRDLQHGFFENYDESVKYSFKEDLNTRTEQKFKDNAVKGIFDNFHKEYEEIVNIIGHELTSEDLTYYGNGTYEIAGLLLVEFTNSPVSINVQYLY